jgi:hypothetical protein
MTCTGHEDLLDKSTQTVYSTLKYRKTVWQQYYYVHIRVFIYRCISKMKLIVFVCFES